MFTAVRAARSPIDRVLATLPASYECLARGEERIVVGPTGAFALTPPLPDVDAAARRVADAASGVREAVAASLSWAPFVDALVVSDDVDETSSGDVGVVPGRHLGGMLTEGPVLLAPEDVSRIAAELRR